MTSFPAVKSGEPPTVKKKKKKKKRKKKIRINKQTHTLNRTRLKIAPILVCSFHFHRQNQNLLTYKKERMSPTTKSCFHPLCNQNNLHQQRIRQHTTHPLQSFKSVNFQFCQQWDSNPRPFGPVPETGALDQLGHIDTAETGFDLLVFVSFQCSASVSQMTKCK